MGAGSSGVSVVIPVYNEIELCDASIRQIHEFMGKTGKPFEIVVIESGSTDASGEVCDSLARSLTNLRVIHEGRKNGMGAALRLGYANSRMDLVWLVTVDLPFPLDTLLAALPLMQSHDCVLSYRVGDKRGVLRGIQSWAYSTLVRRSLRLPMRSVNSAFKLFRREFVQSLPLISKGWFLDAELLYWVARKNLRYTELPVPILDRQAGKSSVTATDWLKTLRELFAFRRAVRRLRH